MRLKSITATLLLSACLLPLLMASTLLEAQEIQLQGNPPERYTVQKGDTLWSIARKYLKDPWRWPEIWRLNREQVKNPHWIYPGDVIVLDKAADGNWRLSIDRSDVRLSPTTRVEKLAENAIPSIPPGDIEPYLSRPLVTGPDGLAGAAQIVAGRDARVVRGEGDMVYAVGLDEKAGTEWVIYRPGNVLRSFDTNEILGYEQRFLGTGHVTRFAEVSSVQITSAKEEIQFGDLLIPAPREEILNYVPHAPEKAIDGRIIDLAKDQSEAGRGNLVTLDRGTRDGLEVGDVLAIFHVAPLIVDPRPYDGPDVMLRLYDRTRDVLPPARYLNIAPERTGLLFVYRVFDKVSFAIVLNSTDPIFVGDLVRKP